MKKIVSDTEFVVYVEELRSNLAMRQIGEDEDISRWIHLPPHTNVVAAFDTIEHEVNDKKYKFSLAEVTNFGDMYRYIQTLNLDLGISIPLTYMEMIYDCMI